MRLIYVFRSENGFIKADFFFFRGETKSERTPQT
jgi:hypothetical protein